MDGRRDRKDGNSREMNGQRLKNRQETRDEGQRDSVKRSQEETSQAACSPPWPEAEVPHQQVGADSL